MSLTLVGQALTCLVAHSSHARLSALGCCANDQSAVSGYNSHPPAGYSPLPVTFVRLRG